jgi:GR25 family glycosyltransferase involved in LPS biosynthesis
MTLKKIWILTPPHCFFIAHQIKLNLLTFNIDCKISCSGFVNGCGEIESDKFGINDIIDNDNYNYIVISPQTFTVLPKRYIAYQVEQKNSKWFDSGYINILKNSHSILDYSIDNIIYLRSKGLYTKQFSYAPVGGIPNYKQFLEKNGYRFAPQEEKYDVLFYGSVCCERRQKIINELSNSLNIHVATNCFGPEIVTKILNSRVVVNLHYYEDAILETTRLHEILSLGVPIVSEDSIDTHRYSDLAAVVKFVKSGCVSSLIEEINLLLNDEIQYNNTIESINRYVNDSHRKASYYFSRYMLAWNWISFNAFYKFNEVFTWADLSADKLQLKENNSQPIPIYCINLKRATERRERMQQVWAEERGIELTFFDAYDRSDYTKSTLPSPYKENYEAVTDKERENIWEGYHGRWWEGHLGELCCSISHCELLKKLIDLDVPEAIILEDDAEPLFDTAEEFFGYINLCKNEEQSPNMLLLHEPDDEAKANLFHVKQELEFSTILDKPMPCTQAIYYTRQGMVDAYEAGSKLKGPIDYSTAFGIVQKGSLGIVKKPLVHHPITTTYIGGWRELVTDEDFTREIDADFDYAFYSKKYPDLANYYIERIDLSPEQRLFHHYRVWGRAEGRQKNKRVDLTVVTALLAGDTNIDKTVASLLPFLTSGEIKWVIKYSESQISKDLEHLSTLPNTKIICQSDLNLYDAFNQALNYIETTYFLVLGSGDTFVEDATAHISAAIHNAPDADGYFFSVHHLAEGFDMLPNITRVYHGPPWPVCHQGVIMRADYVIKIDGFDTRYNIAADYDLICRYINMFDNIVCDQNVISTYLGGGLSEQREIECILEQNLSKYRNFTPTDKYFASTITKHIDGFLSYRRDRRDHDRKLNKIHTTVTDCNKIFIPTFERSLYKVHPDLEIKYMALDSAGSYKTPGWLSAMKQKLELIYECLCDADDEDEIFMYSDLDIQFFAPFRSYIEELLMTNDIVFQNDCPEYCTGFFACKKTDAVKDLFKTAITLLKYKSECDQTVINEVIHVFPSIVKYVLPNEFFTVGMHGGKVWDGEEFEIPENIIMHHANWTVGIDNKIKLLEQVRAKQRSQALERLQKKKELHYN